MERRHMSDRQFQTLYDHHLPGLYRAALFLTGDQAAAERAAGQAFLHTAINPAYAADERIFSVESARLLYDYCVELAPEEYRLPKGFERIAFPVEPARMTLAQRGVAIFSAMGQREADISRILGLGRTTVRRYLCRFVPGVRIAESAAAKLMAF